MKMHWWPMLPAALVLVSTAVVRAQDSATTRTAETGPAEVAEAAALRARLASAAPWLMDVSTTELKIRLVPLATEELEQRRDAAMQALRQVADALAEALSQQVRLLAGTADQDRLAALKAHIEALRDVRQTLVSRVRVVLTALAERGRDVAEAEAYVQAVEQLEPQGEDPLSPTLSDEEVAAQRLAERVAQAVARVRDMPPVHERKEPWTVSIEELQLELQPLRQNQIDERLQKWLDILQRELRERIRIEIALRNTEDDAERQALADESAAQDEIVQAIVERVKAMMVLLQKRGGETQEYQDYIANATGQRLNLTNPAILMAQAKSWLRSQSGGVKWGLNILRFVAIFALFWVLSRLAGWITSSAVRRIPKCSALLQAFLSGFARRATLIIGLVVAVSTLGVTIGPLIAAIGAVGLVVGLALQGTLSNFASGLLILVTRPYDVGDVINAGGVFGKVDAMNLVSTRILTFDNQVMLVPNNEIWNGVITNLTSLSTRRVDMVFGIGYGDDIPKAQQVIEETVRAHPKVLAEPAPMVKVSELGDSSVNFIVRPWARTADYWDVYWDLTREIKLRFDAEGITIPFPQRDVHFYPHGPLTSGGTDA